MKKQLLLGTALLIAISAFPQSNKTVARPSNASIYNMGVELKMHRVGVEEKPISPMFGSSQSPSQSSSSRPASPPTAISWQLLSGSSNVYGQLVSSSRPLQYNPNVNAVSYIHRKSDHYVESPGVPNDAKTGVVVAQISSDWGATWDSTALWADQLHAGRYPQGGIYSPTGNTSLSNAYVVGSGPTVAAGLSFTGNWYASKKLDVFNNTASTAPGAQQFLSFSLASYPPHQPPHGWSRTGFSSTDDGIVRSLALIANDPATLSGLRGYAVATGTFNGTAFDWKIDSLIPNCVTNASGEKYLNEGQMVWNQAGTIGYVIGIGVLNGGVEANQGYQPIVWKMDRNQGPTATWTLQPSIDFNSMAMRPVVVSRFDNTQGMGALYLAANNDTIGAPFFNDFDAAVDSSGRLHVGATFYSHAYGNADSLNFIYTYTTTINPSERYTWRHVNGHRPYIYDFISDGNSWNYVLVDSISSEGPSPASGGRGYIHNPWDPSGTNGSKISINSRLQMGRTPGGEYITFSWVESDSLFTNNSYKWNSLPDIKTRMMRVSPTGAHAMDAGPRLNISANDNNVRTRATLHYMSPVTSSATIFPSSTGFYTVDVNVPFTVTNSNPYAQLQNNANWYGGALASFQFKQPSTVGINENGGTLSTSSIYPNPTHNSAVLAMVLDKNVDVDVKIYNMVGQNVRAISTNGHIGENTVKLDLAGLPSGIYLVNVKAGDSKVTKKLIVQ